MLRSLKGGIISRNKESFISKSSLVFSFNYFYEKLSALMNTIKGNDEVKISFNEGGFNFLVSDGDVIYAWILLRFIKLLDKKSNYNKINVTNVHTANREITISKTDLVKLYSYFIEHKDSVTEDYLVYLEVSYDTIFKQISSIKILKFELVIDRCLQLLHRTKEPMYYSTFKFKRLNLSFEDFEYLREEETDVAIKATSLHNLIYQYNRVIKVPMNLNYFCYIFDIINSNIYISSDDYIIDSLPFVIRELWEEDLPNGYVYLSVKPINYSILRINNDDFLENCINKLWFNYPDKNPTAKDIIIANCKVELYGLDGTNYGLYCYKKGNYNFTISALLDYLYMLNNPYFQQKLDYLGQTTDIFRENFRF